MKSTVTRRRIARLRRLKALMVKEGLQVVRDPSSILIAFVLPMILLFLFGYGVSLDARGLRLGIVLDDLGPEARSLAAAFHATPFFEAKTALNRNDLKADLVSGRLRGVIVIPQDFGARLRSLEAPAVQLLTDGSETNTANYVANYVQGTILTWSSGRGLSEGRTALPRIEMASRFFYNPELDSRHTLVPGSLAIIMAIIGTLLTALVVAREWERGTMESLLATPLGPVEIIIGKLVPYFILGMASMAVCTGISVFLFGIPFLGSVAALVMVSASFLLAALGQGFLISTIARNQFVASQIALVTGFLPAFILSGFIFEIASMPWMIRQMTRIIPARYLVTNLQTIFMAGDVWPLLVPNTLVLLAIALVMFLLTLRKTPDRLE
ncbi:MAG: ABC transporter permease [Desulfobacterales bacterium]